jgi:hypothetical protein
LASIPIHLQTSRSLALPLHSLIPIFLRSMDTSSKICFYLFKVFSLPLVFKKFSLLASVCLIKFLEIPHFIYSTG